MVWDLDRPLEEDCSLVFLKFDDEEAQAVSLEFVLFFLKFAFALFILMNASPIAVTPPHMK